MKNLLRIAMIFIAVLTVGTTLQSCKKGTDDPAISFKSRKARVAGEYTLTAMNTTGEEKDYSKSGNCEETNNVTYTKDYNNSMLIRTVTGTRIVKNCFGQKDSTYAISSKDTTYMTMEFTFEKEGNYKWITTITEDPKQPVIKYVTTQEGTWNFVSGVGEVKNKEQIILSETKTTESYTNSLGIVTTEVTESKSTYSTIISLRSLKSDEMIMVITEEYKSANGYNTSKETTELTVTEK